MDSSQVRLHAWGDYGLFTRPELKTERMSYDVMTPSAARGVLDAIHWKPAFRWIIERIHVLRPIRFENLKRNEVGKVIPARTARAAMRKDDTSAFRLVVDDERHQRASALLRDVGYVIDARIELTGRTPGDTVDKHHRMFTRRARLGQCFHRPYLGTRECVCHFELVENSLPASTLPTSARNQDLGLMFHDFDYADERRTPRFFKARMQNGVIEIPHPDSRELNG